ncbi:MULTISPECIES: LacI family DNA-binding transcriptional regulator [unclassified Micromonospora]|uniref:LacI family DNA-binding transcriptional regulator n=1 Tax=unclassified Micromonospora TaxID=2617518 RepID=UPI001033D10A|nr:MULTISPECIES: LacI family DNA-binding transcriptional regulator [unclassified Micromonospora]QKW15262.1 LacI family DNA-binding transcriptional regulator [Verrucosispora sp. NA02020]TBL37554.1 LacI family transcriptional regulator [Verrucosispora sp. SN26_14.1]
MAEVARIAGVSTTTVSHVLNKTRKVAPETEELVRKALESTGYRHNLAARALATQSTDTIGLAMSVVTNPYFAALIRDIERHLRRAGYTLILADTNDDPEVELDVINHLLARRVSGLIVNPLEGHGELTQCLQKLLDEQLPTIFLDRRSTLPGDQVYSECLDSIHHLTAHLAAQGHHRIGYVRGAMREMSAQDRLAGYQRAVAELGLADDPGLVIAGESDERTTEQRLVEHLASDEPATALVVSNNQMTLGALRAIRRTGLKVPHDIALVCYDDFEWADLFDPQISAMAQDAARLASTAVELLLARIRRPDRAPQSVVVPATFRHRDSCGCGAVPHQTQGSVDSVLAAG